MAEDETVKLTPEAGRALADRALRACGVGADAAEAMVDVVLRAEADEARSHGLYRIPGCVAAVRSGKVDPAAVPTVRESRGAVVRVDARGGFAPPALALGRPLLEAKAVEHGLAALAVHDCYHFSALWADVEGSAGRGLAALSCTVGMHCVALAGGRSPALGTNPFAFAFPRGPGREPFVFDISTSAVARGEVELHRRDGKSIPDGWALDEAGRPTNDPGAALRGAILPFGGHKGSALGLMVELLAGPLIGELRSADALASDTRDGGPLRGGYLMIALSPAFFGDAVANLADADAWLARLEAEHRPARLPGTRRLQARSRTRAGGISIPVALYDELRALGNEGTA